MNTPIALSERPAMHSFTHQVVVRRLLGAAGVICEPAGQRGKVATGVAPGTRPVTGVGD